MSRRLGLEPATLDELRRLARALRERRSDARAARALHGLPRLRLRRRLHALLDLHDVDLDPHVRRRVCVAPRNGLGVRSLQRVRRAEGARAAVPDRVEELDRAAPGDERADDGAGAGAAMLAMRTRKLLRAPRGDRTTL